MRCREEVEVSGPGESFVSSDEPMPAPAKALLRLALDRDISDIINSAIASHLRRLERTLHQRVVAVVDVALRQKGLIK